MPHERRFLGVNSVTNGELNKGDSPAPIIRNVRWLENSIDRRSQKTHKSRFERCPNPFCAHCAQQRASYPGFSIVAIGPFASIGEKG